jgi:hypothetical protein
MFIDCQRCRARGAGCGDCAAVTLLGADADVRDLEPAEIRALNVLASAGLIPPLRYVPRLARAS